MKGLRLFRRTEVASASGSAPEVLTNRQRIVVFGSNLVGATALTDSLNGFLQRTGLTDVEAERERFTNNIDAAFYGRQSGESAPPTLPMGVVVFPEMRQELFDGSKMFVPAPVAHIGALCAKHNVPMLEMGHADGAEALPGAGGLEALVGQMAARQLAIESGNAQAE